MPLSAMICRATRYLYERERDMSPLYTDAGLFAYMPANHARPSLCHAFSR